MRLNFVEWLHVGEEPAPSGSVHIPYAELADRVHELPPRGCNVRVVPSVSSAEAVQFLNKEGWNASVDQGIPEPVDSPILWRPSPLVAEIAATGSFKWLDLGCGSGRDAVFAASCGNDVIGVDRLPDAITMARELGQRYSPQNPVRFEVSDVIDATKQFASWADVVSMVWFYDRTIVEELVTLLRPGAKVVIDTFSVDSHRRTGHPRQMWCVDPADTFSPFTIVRLQESMRNGKFTAQVVLER